MVGMDIIYRFGVPLSQQLDPDAVDVMRNLVGNKYDFVDRNYDIVMQYRKQELINISLPAEMRAEAKETIIIPATVNKTKYGLKKINWTVSPSFIANGGSYQVISPTQLEIILPAYVYKTQKNAAQEYQISAVGIDNNDNESNRATTTIRVKPSRNVVNDLIVEPNSVLPANDRDHFTTTAVITNEHGQPLSHQVITFHVDGLKQQDGKLGATLSNGSQSATNGDGITATTDSQGKAVIYITSKVAGEDKITATMENGNYKNGPLKFSADRNSAQIAKLNVTKDKALADGKEKNMLYALVTDQNGNAVENIAVNLTATDGTVIENGTTANTNQRGELIFGVTSTKAGSSEVTAEINGSQKTQSVAFVTGHPSAEKSLLTVQPATIVANGKTAANLKLELKDAQGNPISGDKVDFTTSLTNSQIKNTKEVGNGVYTAELTGISAGESTVGVKINGSVLKVKLVTVVFEADRDTMIIKKGNLIILKDYQFADGKAKNQLKAVVTDANNNLVPNVSVKFEADNGAMPALQTVDTNVNGEAKFDTTNKKAGGVTIRASINNSTQQQEVNFVADTSTAVITDSNLVIKPDNSPADGVTKNEVTATVTDAEANPVPNMDVTFTVSEGATITTVKGKTGEDGKATATVVSKKAGVYTVTAKVNGKATDKETTFKADSKSAALAQVQLDGKITEKAANGKNSFTFIAVVKDANDNLVPDVEVTRQQNKGNDVTLPKPASSNTNTKGEAKIILTSTIKAVGGIQVSAQLKGGEAKDADRRVSFVGDISTAKIQINSLKKNNIVPTDNQSEYPFEISATDTNGNVLKDYALDVVIPELSISEKFTTDNQGKVKYSPKSAKAGSFEARVTSSTNTAVSDTLKVQYTITTLSSSH